MAMYLDLGPYANPSYYVVQVRRMADKELQYRSCSYSSACGIAVIQ
jgi:hypothetical protein